MRRLQRLPLSDGTVRVLEQRTAKVTAADDPAAEAKRLWNSKSNRAFDEVRAKLRKMASGLERCNYCEDGQGTDIEHFYPKAQYPKKAFTWENYLLACSHCNSNQKRSLFPTTADDEPLLIDPTVDDPLEHLALTPSTGRYRDRGEKGAASIRVFGLNREVLEKGRQDTWEAVENLLVRYAQLRASSEHERAEKIERVVRRHPFAGVFAHLLEISQGPGAELLISAECRQALRTCPEIRGWLE